MLLSWIWLAEKTGLSAYEKISLLQHFSSPEEILQADEAALAEQGNISHEAVNSLMDKDTAAAEKILEACAKGRIHVLCWQDSHYPSRLRHIGDPPLVLYYKGTLPDFENQLFLGVVGTRKASTYGLTSAKRIGRQIGGCGAVVVTGMASGVDTMAANGALAAQAPVVGVLGCGVDMVYPASNRSAYARVAEKGCLISEYPPGTRPYAWNFPKRNRIISGISQGVVVVEAPEKSGALITARQAMEQGRDVFVVPGNIGVASCAGSNALLRDGAIMISCGWDAVSEYTHLFPDKLHPETLSPEPEGSLFETVKVAQPVADIPAEEEEWRAFDKKSIDKSPSGGYSGVNENAASLPEQEAAVLACIPVGEHMIDDVIEATGLPPTQALSAMTMLELRGYIQTLPGQRVSRIM